MIGVDEWIEAGKWWLMKVCNRLFMPLLANRGGIFLSLSSLGHLSEQRVMGCRASDKVCFGTEGRCVREYSKSTDDFPSRYWKPANRISSSGFQISTGSHLVAP